MVDHYMIFGDKMVTTFATASTTTTRMLVKGIVIVLTIAVES